MRTLPRPKRKQGLLIALLCGLPVTFMVIYGLPWMLAASLATLMSSPSASALLGIAFVVACVLSLTTYWRLALSTARQRRFDFGPLFWVSVAGACFSAFEISRWFDGLLTWLLLVGPPAVSAAYFAALQRRGFPASDLES